MKILYLVLSLLIFCSCQKNERNPSSEDQEEEKPVYERYNFTPGNT